MWLPLKIFLNVESIDVYFLSISTSHLPNIKAPSSFYCTSCNLSFISENSAVYFLKAPMPMDAHLQVHTDDRSFIQHIGSMRRIYQY